ncbi:MAG: flotillin-like FloA family protein [Planctomycetota bacterium]
MQNPTTIFLAAPAPAKVLFMTILIVVATVMLVSCLVLAKFFRLWLQAKLSNAEVTFAELVGMSLRRVDVRQIVLCRITAVQSGLDLTRLDLETHYHAGGNVANVVRALIVARRENINLSWKDATVIDLAGRDILAEVQAAVKTKVQPDPNAIDEQKLNFGDVGEAVSDLNPRGQAKFGTIVVDVVADGLFISKKSKVEILENHADNIVVRAVPS